MKKLFVATTLLLLLTACGGKTVKFTVTYDGQGPAPRWEQLQAAIGRIVEGRMEAKQKKVLSQNITANNEGPTATLTVTVSDTEAAKLLQE